MKKTIANIDQRILQTLAYFDVFSYPLTKDELISYTVALPEEKELAEITLGELVSSGLVRSQQGFFYLGNHPWKVNRRIAGNKRARVRFRAARFYSRIISYFPFVRGVFLTGSISKGFMSYKDDIDYFIVTSPGRLWTVRTMLTLFKKIFLLNSHRNFCINYFLDENHLHVEEKNRFTATELAFIVPIYGNEAYLNILDQNQWVNAYYPFFKPGHTSLMRTSRPIIKRIMEFAIKARLFDSIERYLLSSSKNYIQKKYAHMDQAAFDYAFSILPHELIYLPNRQQNTIMHRFKKKINELNQHVKSQKNPEYNHFG